MSMHSLIKCILVVLVFLGLAISSKDLMMSYVSNVVEKAKKCIMLDQIKMQI